jgi:regulatory protein
VELGIRFLARGRRFEREVRAHLRKKGVGRAEIDAAIERLKELSLVDDPETARAWVRDRMRFAPKGRGLLRAALLKKGVPRAIADEAVADAGSPASELASAEALVRKLAGRAVRKDPAAERRRLWSALARRGFDPGTAREAIARVLGDRAASAAQEEDLG